MHLDSFGVHRLKDIKRRKNCLGMLPFFLEFQLELVRVSLSQCQPRLLLCYYSVTFPLLWDAAVKG